MADNVDVTPGTGKTVLADEVTDATLGTGVIQLVKLADGTLNSTTKINAGAGTSTNALRVVLASDQASVPVSGTLTDAQLRASAVPVSGPLTDAQLRATPISVSIGAALSAGSERSGSITTGGTAQTLAASNAVRTALKGQNIDATADLWVNEIGGTAAVATAGSYKVPAGATFSINTNRAISILGATTGQKFTATEY
jgi:hypothetical protein